MSRIDITIDRLVLRGFDPANQHTFVKGLRAELSHILADPAVRVALARSRRVPVLRLGRVSMESGLGGARKLGNGVAQAIGKGMKP